MTPALTQVLDAVFVSCGVALLFFLRMAHLKQAATDERYAPQTATESGTAQLPLRVSSTEVLCV